MWLLKREETDFLLNVESLVGEEEDDYSAMWELEML